ncbi:MAG: hypothetical protein ACJAX3_002863 [Patiriisocius sp.]
MAGFQMSRYQKNSLQNKDRTSCHHSAEKKKQAVLALKPKK